jgi:murein DD-endopeptidase MepM/ murein hydrolase activator NlpD
MKQTLKQIICFNSKCISAILLAIFLFFTLSLFIYFIPPEKNMYAETIEEVEEELEKVKQERESTKKKIEQAKVAEAEYMSQVKHVEGNLVVALAELDDLNSQRSDLKSQIDKLTVDLVIQESELAEIESLLNEKNGILNNRVATIYKNREQDVLQLLFETDSFSKFFSSLKLMNLIAQQDLQILQDVQETRELTVTIKDKITEIKEDEKQQKNQVEVLVGEAENKKREVEGIYHEKQRLLSQTRANKEALIKMEKELEEKQEEITRQLEALRYGAAPGRLLYPTRGVLTSGFGYRISPLSGTKRFHGGIDIGADTGTAVMAAAGGKVLSAGYMGGYGYAILIYHGGGVATFYAHLSGFAVSSGQSVKQGQTIGYVGSTGYSTGPHLHFEVRVNGAQQNPYNFF